MNRRTEHNHRSSHRLSATAALACGVMLMVPVAAFTRVVSSSPLRLESRLMLQPISGLDWGAHWSPGSTSLIEQQKDAFNHLGLVVLVLSVVGALIAVFSFVALQLGAASARRTEFATRAALGATPAELITRLTKESAALAGVAVVVGTVPGLVAVRFMESMWPHIVVGVPLSSVFARALLSALVVGTCAVTVTVLLAYLTTLRGSLAAALTGGSRVTATAAELQIRDALAVLQFAGVLVLLSGAFVLVRESRPNLATDSPARPDLYVARLELNGEAFEDVGARSELLEALQNQIAAVPGVRAETLASVGAWLGLGTSDRSIVECGLCFKPNRLYTPYNAPRVRLMSVMPGFFELLGLEVEQGRSFTTDDRLGAPLSVVVNRPLARMQFEASKPVGRYAQPHDLGTPAHLIRGAVAPTRAPVIGSAQNMDYVMYLSALQHPPRSLDVLVLVDGEARTLAALEQLRSKLPAGATLESFAPSSLVIHTLAAPMRFFAVVLVVLAVIVLLLGLHGSYALQQYRVLNLRRDLGVRIAVGATPRMLTGHVLRGAFRIAVAGLVIGTFGAFAAMRAVQVLVPTASRFAPDLFFMIFGVLTTAAMAGALRPARRAAQIDPATTLAA